VLGSEAPSYKVSVHLSPLVCAMGTRGAYEPMRTLHENRGSKAAKLGVVRSQ
jgi:hypothetical protein